MVIPIGTSESEHGATPIITYLLIIVNVAAFLVEQSLGQPFVRHWAFTPRQFFADPFGHFPTLITAMFLHGSWLHLIGNMAYLWTFGDNVEDDFGHLPFLVFYILAGIAAMIAQGAYTPHSALPSLGASGAIAGVLGAYLVMFPNGTVKFLTNQGIIRVPALIAIGGWIALQFVSVGGELVRSHPPSVGGIAYVAHIGGFIAGIILSFFFRSRQTIGA
jgi:membrane associated rhomboid family serine protease